MKAQKKESIIWAVAILAVFVCFVALGFALEADHENTKKRHREYQEFISSHDCKDTDTKIRTAFMKRCNVSAWSTPQGCHNEWKATYCTPPELKEVTK